MMEISDGKLTIDLGHISPNLKIEFKDKDERFQISDDFELNNEAKDYIENLKIEDSIYKSNSCTRVIKIK